MSEEKQAGGMVKKETLYVAAVACLIIGFLGGIIFGIYKSPLPPQQTVSSPAGPGPAAQQPQLTPDQVNTMLNLEREVAANPNNGEAWTQLGHLYFDSDQPEKAINAYTRSLEIKPDNADILTDLGVMYRRNGQPDKAIETFDKAMIVDPNHQTARFNKGVVLLYDLKDRNGAIKSWEELVAMNPLAAAPNGQPVKELLADLKAQGNK